MRGDTNDVGVSISENKGALLMEDYGDRVRFGDEDHDEALQNAIGYVFRNHNATQQADLHTRIESRWKDTPVGSHLGMVIKEIRAWRNT